MNVIFLEFRNESVSIKKRKNRTGMNSSSSRSPEAIVQENLNFYNDRNIEGFMSSFSADIKLYSFQEEQAILSGLEAVRTFYKKLFDQSPRLYSLIVNRIVFDNKVIDYEFITGRNGATEPYEIILIYEVADSQITKITSIKKV